MQVQTQTTMTDISNASVLRYDLGLRDSGFGLTSSTISKERKSSLVPTLKPSTEEELGLPTARIFTFSLEKPHVKVAPLAAKNYVEGVVISYDEISVKCELIVSGKVVSIQLPRVLFPDSIHYGLPVNIEMVDENGFRKPLITIRKIEEKNTAKIAEEFESILAAL